MASQFQNRLVGISILVSSVVIFLPSIIDGKKMAYEDEFVATPIRPEPKLHTQQLDLQPESNDISNEQVVSTDSEIVEDEQWQVEEVAATVTDEKETVAEAPEKVEKAKPKSPVAEAKMAKNAWTIQLGAFQNAANINSLLKTLHKAGYQAHTVPTDVIDGKLTRLFVGPDVSKEKLEKQLPRLKRLTKLEGKLLPFDAVNP